MEGYKKYIPHIAVGVAAIAVGAYIYSQQSKQVVSADKPKTKEQPKKPEVPKDLTCPAPKDIVDPSKSMEVQQRQLKDWIDGRLARFFKEQGPFKLRNDMSLKKEDFNSVYEIIECTCRVQLQNIRGENEETRRKLFVESFMNKLSLPTERKAAQKNYLAEINKNVNQEMHFIGEILKEVLKHTKINEHVWQVSSDAWMPEGELLIMQTLMMFIVSPFKFYSNSVDVKSVATNYLSGSDFSLELVRGQKQEYGDFQQLLRNQLIEDGSADEQQEYLIYMDYILFDYIYHTHGIKQLQMKTMLSGSGLVQEAQLQNQFKKCIKVFMAAEQRR